MNQLINQINNDNNQFVKNNNNQSNSIKNKNDLQQSNQLSHSENGSNKIEAEMDAKSNQFLRIS